MCFKMFKYLLKDKKEKDGLSNLKTVGVSYLNGALKISYPQNIKKKKSVYKWQKVSFIYLSLLR